MQPLMKCNICHKVFEPGDTHEHKETMGHNSWTMVRTIVWLRNYTCRICGDKVHVDTKDRLCLTCKGYGTYEFILPDTRETINIPAPDAEIATLLAWQVNPKYTFNFKVNRVKLEVV